MNVEFSNLIPKDHRIRNLIQRIEFSIFDKRFMFWVGKDTQYSSIYIQVKYYDIDPRTSYTEQAMKEVKVWEGRKMYIDDDMTEDEIIKSVWLACELAVRHETMKGFKVDGIMPFNPNNSVDFLTKKK